MCPAYPRRFTRAQDHPRAQWSLTALVCAPHPACRPLCTLVPVRKRVLPLSRQPWLPSRPLPLVLRAALRCGSCSLTPPFCAPDSLLVPVLPLVQGQVQCLVPSCSGTLDCTELPGMSSGPSKKPSSFGLSLWF